MDSKQDSTCRIQSYVPIQNVDLVPAQAPILTPIFLNTKEVDFVLCHFNPKRLPLFIKESYELYRQ